MTTLHQYSRYGPDLQAVIDARSAGGVVVSPKGKLLNKYGQRADLPVGSWATISTLAGSEFDETYLATGDGNLIDSVVSSSAADVGQILLVEGHYEDASGLSRFHVQLVTINGQTPVTLTQPLWRVTRMYNTSNEGEELAGDVYGYEGTSSVVAGVPQTDTAVHIIIPAGLQQTQKAATAFSSVDMAAMTKVFATCLRNTGAATTVETRIEKRKFDKVWRPIHEWRIRTDEDHLPYHFDPYEIIEEGSDIRMQANAGGTGVTVFGRMHFHLLSVKSAV